MHRRRQVPTGVCHFNSQAERSVTGSQMSMTIRLWPHTHTHRHFLSYFDLHVCFPESIIPLVIGAVCVLFFVVLAAILVKRFAIDLTLFFRSYFPLSSYNKGKKDYFFYQQRIQKTRQGVQVTPSETIVYFSVCVLIKQTRYKLLISQLHPSVGLQRGGN